MNQIFFQSSLPRAGSTLLQNILGQNPDFYPTPTSGILNYLTAARDSYTYDSASVAQNNELMTKAFLNFCYTGLIGYFNALTDKKYVVDKSREWGINYSWLNQFYPNPKILCMVRDLRSIYTSMETKFRLHPHRSKQMFNLPKLTNTTTRKRVDHWAQSTPVGTAVEGLEQMIFEGIDKHILFIRFEDLTQNPQAEMDKIYNYLGLESYKHDFQNVEQVTHEDDKIHGIFGDHTIRREVKPVEEKFNEVLGEQISADIVSTYSWFYEYFKYL